MSDIHRCRDQDMAAILEIINAAAEAYRGVIPPHQWHDPYMPAAQLRREIEAGVVFWAYSSAGQLLGVMGIQAVRDVDLLRHAYVLPGQQRRGIGAALIGHLQRESGRRMLVGTWAAAHWAIEFYRRHGFQLASPEQKTTLLATYWTIPQAQIDASVVLANPPLD